MSRRVVRAPRPLLTTALAAALGAAAGCAAPPRSTRFAAEDFQAMGTAMAQSLARSEALARRGPESPLWVVSINQVTNLTSDVMSAGEKWGVVERVRSALPMADLGRQKNVRFVVAAERRRRAPELDLSAGVTHTLAATFRSATRATAEARTELYFCEFELLDLRTGEPVWTDRFEYKRAARGKIWD